MDCTFSIPTPKTPKHQTTRDVRLRIQTLYFLAHWTIDQILLAIPGVTHRQVEYAIEHRLTPQHQLWGCKVKLNTPNRKRLIEWITQNKKTRQEDWYSIPVIFGWNCGIKAIQKALEIEGYVHRIARQKPPLSEAQRAIRLQWAIEHRDWTFEQWSRILWSDESWVKPGRHRRTWITRKKGPSEVYHPDCVIPRVQRKIGWMF